MTNEDAPLIGAGSVVRIKGASGAVFTALITEIESKPTVMPAQTPRGRQVNLMDIHFTITAANYGAPVPPKETRDEGQ